MEKKVKIEPQNERVLVKPIMVKNETASGLIMGNPNEDKIETTFAEIVKVSEDLKEKHKVGEIVYHSARAGIKVALHGKKFKILTDMEILLKLTVEKGDLENVVKHTDNLL